MRVCLATNQPGVGEGLLYEEVQAMRVLGVLMSNDGCTNVNMGTDLSPRTDGYT